MIKKILKIALAAIAAIVFIFLALLAGIRDANNFKTSVLKGLNIQLMGVVYDVDYVDEGFYHGSGIVRLRIITSNVKEYHPPASAKYFYCVIKKQKAEIYEGATGVVPGDTITIDTERQLIGIFGPGKYGRQHEVGSISVSSDDGYYNYIKHHHQF